MPAVDWTHEPISAASVYRRAPPGLKHLLADLSAPPQNTISDLRHVIRQHDFDLYVTILGMKSHDLKTVLARVQTWPEGAKEEAVKALREIEEDFIIGPATRHELDRSHQEALRGKGVSLEDIKERLGM
jgi:hypothetical protein